MDKIVQTFWEKAVKTGKIQKAYLFGSRARGDHRPDSDYDILLVADESFGFREKDALYEIVMDILFETGRLVSLKIWKVSEFQRLCRLQTPFMRHILKEGVQVG